MKIKLYLMLSLLSVYSGSSCGENKEKYEHIKQQCLEFGRGVSDSSLNAFKYIVAPVAFLSIMFHIIGMTSGEKSAGQLGNLGIIGSTVCIPLYKDEIQQTFPNNSDFTTARKVGNYTPYVGAVVLVFGAAVYAAKNLASASQS